MMSFEIAGRPIGGESPCFIIAEAGVNHNGNIALARRLIDVAAEAKADAVKFQTFNAERLVTKAAPKATYQKRGSDAAESQLEMLRRLELSVDAHRELMAHCRARGVLFLSTPFDEICADLLDELGLPAFKLPSGEITNLPLLSHVARKKKPVILSTGMAGLGEVETAVGTLRAGGVTQLAVLQCVSNYPAAPADVNLRAMHTLRVAFGLPIGYSDHTTGVGIALAARALGACIIEKHFTLDRTLPGPDHQASLEPAELAALVHGVRDVEAALGDGRKVRRASEEEVAQVARKSLVAAVRIPAGAAITAEMLALRRPGTGLAPAMLPYVTGRHAREEIPPATVLSFDLLA